MAGDARGPDAVHTRDDGRGLMDALLALWDGAFGSAYAIWSATLVRATPLLLV